MRTLSTLLHTQPFSPPHTAPPCIHAVLGREQHVPPLLLHPTPLLFPWMKTRGTRRKEGEVCVCGVCLCCVSVLCVCGVCLCCVSVVCVCAVCLCCVCVCVRSEEHTSELQSHV